MIATDTTAGWSLATRLLHWVSAVLVLGLLVVGTLMVRLDDVGLRFDIYQHHKATGVLLLLITCLRLAWRGIARDRLAADGWQQRMASIAHASLYVLIIAVILSGLAMVATSPLPIPISIFGLFDLPQITRPDLADHAAAKSVHGWLTKSLAALVAIHIAAALKHHLIDRNAVLLRMWRG